MADPVGTTEAGTEGDAALAPGNEVEAGETADEDAIADEDDCDSAARSGFVPGSCTGPHVAGVGVATAGESESAAGTAAEADAEEVVIAG